MTNYEQAERDLARMSQSPLDMVREFHKAMNLKLGANWGAVETDMLEGLRMDLINEEYDEVVEAHHNNTSNADLLKELADLVYVTYGYAATFGWDLDEAVRRVHESNMSKLDDEGHPIYRGDGKVMKGPNYKKPDLKDLV